MNSWLYFVHVSMQSLRFLHCNVNQAWGFLHLYCRMEFCHHVCIYDAQNRWCVRQQWVTGHSFTTGTLQCAVSLSSSFCFTVNEICTSSHPCGSQEKGHPLHLRWMPFWAFWSSRLWAGIRIGLLTSLHIFDIAFFPFCYFGSSKIELTFGWGRGTCCIYFQDCMWYEEIKFFFWFWQPKEKKKKLKDQSEPSSKTNWLTGEWVHAAHYSKYPENTVTPIINGNSGSLYKNLKIYKRNPTFVSCFFFFRLSRSWQISTWKESGQRVWWRIKQITGKVCSQVQVFC